MSTQSMPSPRRRSSVTLKREPSLIRPRRLSESGSSLGRKPRSPGSAERSVKRLRLSKALTIPENTMVSEACRRMAMRRVDAALLTDSSALLCGILTDKDIATRLIAEKLKPEETPVSAVMTKNPTYVMSDSSAVDALQKMVQGKFRHLPVVENGEVIALLDITKCLYDAIARLEKVAEKGDAIAAAVQGVELQYGTANSAPLNLVEVLREKLYRPSLASIIQENVKVATVLPSESVYEAAKKMQELRSSCVIVTINNKPRGILTSRDILMRVLSQNLPVESTPVEKVMTLNPECITIDTAIVDALHIMHDGKFLHLPIVDQGGYVVACVDVLHLTNAAVAMLGNNGVNNDVTSTMMQKFWDSALAMEPPEDDEEIFSENSLSRFASEFGPDIIKSQTTGLMNPFTYKFEDTKGRVHRFHSGTENVSDLVSAVEQRLESESVSTIMYEDEEGDRVVLVTDTDLVAAVTHAKLSGSKVLKLHIDTDASTSKKVASYKLQNSITPREAAIDRDLKSRSQRWGYTVAVAGAVVVGVSVASYLKRTSP